MSDSGDSESGGVQQIDWESLEGSLSAGALESLRQHLQQQQGDDSRCPPGESDDIAPAPPEPAYDGSRGADVTVAAGGRRHPASARALPVSNLVYKAKDYWDNRFSEEESYDWLASYADVAKHLHEAIPKDSRVLVVGCGNSSLSADMYDDGYRDLLSTDFSAVVIDKMRAKHREPRPGLRWEKMDMLALEAEDASFDAVVDKAAMDALMVDKGDPWNPDPATIEQSHRMCAEVFRVLAPGGVFVQLSFEQVHFRRKFLLGEHEHHCYNRDFAANAVTPGNGHNRIRQQQQPQRDGGDGGSDIMGGGGVYGWDMRVHEIQREGGCFGQFLYILRKRRDDGVSGGDDDDDGDASETEER